MSESMRFLMAANWLELCAAKLYRAYLRRHKPGGHEAYHLARAKHQSAALNYAEELAREKARAA